MSTVICDPHSLTGPFHSGYAVKSLLNALAPIIGAELETGKAVGEGWAEDIDEEKLTSWKKKGLEFEPDMKSVLEDAYSTEFWGLLLKVWWFCSKHVMCD